MGNGKQAIPHQEDERMSELVRDYWWVLVLVIVAVVVLVRKRAKSEAPPSGRDSGDPEQRKNPRS